MARTANARSTRNGLEPTQAKKPDYTEYGVSGTKLFAGILSEETVPQLQGFNAYKSYQGMRLDATGSAMLKAIELPIRSARWFVDPASDDPKDVDMADMCHDVLWEFGSQSFDDVARLALGSLAFGFSILEICWSVIRDGPWAGKVGWDKLAWRSQATKWRWNMDYVNGKRQLVSFTQLAPPYYEQIEIPRNKFLLFVNDLEGDNYDGISALRPAWKDWYIRDQLYRIRAVALERGTMGVPVAKIPDQFSDELAAVARQTVETIRTDEQVGVVLPVDVEFSIEHWEINGPAINAAIDYHNRQMLLAQLAQFLVLGSTNVGSYALSSDQSDLFQMCVNAKANYFAEVLNLEPGLAQLVYLNFPNIGNKDLPRLEHGDIGQRSLDKLGRTLMALGQWGFLTPDDATEDRLRQMLDLPEREEAITERALYDLMQQVMPTDTEYGRVHPGQRLASPLETQALTAQAKTQALKAPAPGAAGAPTGPGTAEQRNATSGAVEMTERAFRLAQNRAALAELVARRPWPRPRGRMTDGQRMAVRATEAITEALEDVFHAGERRPVRPSTWLAMHRRPYEVRSGGWLAGHGNAGREQFAETAGRLLGPGEPRTMLTRQMGLAKGRRELLRSILRPRAQTPPPMPTTAPRAETRERQG